MDRTMKEEYKEILLRSIKKAVQNGYPLDLKFDEPSNSWFYYDKNGNFQVLKSEYEIIFNHEFAKTLWGEEEIKLDFEDGGKVSKLLGGNIEYPYSEGASIKYRIVNWKYRLQKMILSKDPITYLKLAFKEQCTHCGSIIKTYEDND